VIAERQGKSVAEMLATTSAAEIAEWLALFELEVEEAEEARRDAERSSGGGAAADSREPTIGDSGGIAAVIDEARKREGLG